MALSDCLKCWDTPCHCGYDYRNWPLKDLIDMKEMFEKLIKEKELSEKELI